MGAGRIESQEKIERACPRETALGFQCLLEGWRGGNGLLGNNKRLSSRGQKPPAAPSSVFPSAPRMGGRGWGPSFWQLEGQSDSMWRCPRGFWRAVGAFLVVTVAGETLLMGLLGPSRLDHA